MEHQESVASSNASDRHWFDSNQLAVRRFLEERRRQSCNDRHGLFDSKSGPSTILCRSRPSFSLFSVSLIEQAYFEVPVLFTMLPLTLLFLFGLLTMKNIRTVRQTSNHLERQMSRVLLLQTMVVTCCLLPLSANSL